MHILNRDECEKINEVIEYMIHHPKVKVATIKRRFELTGPEYDMISDLMMPAMRQYAEIENLRFKIKQLIGKLKGEPESV